MRIDGEDRAGLERLLRYCVRPSALERLREIDPERLVYESIKSGPGGSACLTLKRLRHPRRARNARPGI